ncbi:flavodoxin family protein [Methanobrevibacter olleyae]|uniref:NADPH-dependent FMN reductase n=1 Tax=Methanobrevibacter olleyae TaxID=294671 RepID=A0A126R3K6_METOL|nr:flavodoxin family protein [Methanobrevibacter olleyae]AMK16235.1 NADPH-dependent FMN reductase [Methanobrevibacter olleyae]
MKIIGISGSPREGASEFLLKKALSELEKEESFETKFITVRDRNINPCTHCDNCVETKGKCSIDDDMNEIYSLLKESDGIILASPIHFGSISAQLKAIIDRCQALIMEDLDIFKNKVGISIVVGGDRTGGQELAIQQINTFYLLNKIIPLSGGAFGANLGACLWSQDGGAEGVKKDEYGLKTLDMTINNFKEFLLEFKC